MSLSDLQGLMTMSQHQPEEPHFPQCQLMDCQPVRAALSNLLQQLAQENWGREPASARRLRNAVVRVQDDLRRHIEAVEEDGGWLQCLSHDCPRVADAVSRMCRQHVLMEESLQQLTEALDVYSGDDPADYTHIRNAALRLLQLVKDHEMLGSAITIDSYFRDLGSREPA